MNTQAHWDRVYATKSVTEVSWYQREPLVSLDLIERVAPVRSAAILDVGGGASTLVDALLARGYTNLSVLDIAAAALDAARKRLGAPAGVVTWRAADVLHHPFAPQSVDVWHDRAVFHFLTDAAERRAYVAQGTAAVRPGGHIIIATFAADGPTQCSGLDVCRYSPDTLCAEFGAGFDLVAQAFEEHITPSGGAQRFQYSVLALR